MKKIFIALLVLILIIAAAIGIFLATFNADRYRPILTENISKALGRPVDLGKLSLVWNNGFAIHAEALAVYSDASKKEASLKLKGANAFVEFAPLLQKRLEISTLVVQAPVVYLERSVNGQIGLKGITLPQPSTSGSSSSSASSGQVFGFSMKKIHIEDAEIHFVDSSAQPPLHLSVLNLDADVLGFSVTEPFSVAAKAGLFDERQNVSAQAKIMLPSGSDPGYAEDVIISTDLSLLNWKEISKAVPALASSGLQGLPTGKLRQTAKRVSFDPNTLGSLQANLKWEDGSIQHQAIKSPIENIDLSLSLKGPDLVMDSFDAKFAKGSIKATALLQQYRTQPQTSIRWASRDLAIDELTPAAANPNAPKLSGRLSLDFEGQALGMAWPQISQTLSGQGQLTLKDGVLLNYNVLREVIQKISIIPGAEDMIKNRLPGIYKAKLNEPSTILKPLTLPFQMQNGQMIFNQFGFDTDFLAIRGAGQVGLDKTVQAGCVVLLDRDLTAAIVASVPQTQLIVNANGNLEIPIKIGGQLPHIVVTPDMDYLGSKLLAGKAQEIVTGLIQDPEKGVAQVKNLLQGSSSAGGAQVKDTFSQLLGGSKDASGNLSGNDLLGNLLGDSSKQNNS